MNFGKKTLSPILAFLAFLASLAALAGCVSGGVSHSVKTLHHDIRHPASMFVGREIAVLPFMTSGGAFAETDSEAGSDFATEVMVGRLRTLRPDLIFVTREEFENSFPPRFDRRLFGEFYGRIFKGDDLAGGLDSLWAFVKQPYMLVFSLKDGARISNMDKSYFKHVTVTCEIVNRESKRVIWRATCKGVSDDKHVTDNEIIIRSMRHLAEEIPAVAPDYDRERW